LVRGRDEHSHRHPNRLLEPEHRIGARLARLFLDQRHASFASARIVAALHARRRGSGGGIKRLRREEHLKLAVRPARRPRRTDVADIGVIVVDAPGAHRRAEGPPRPPDPPCPHHDRSRYVYPARPSSYMRSIERVSSRVMRLARTAISAKRRTRATMSSRE